MSDQLARPGAHQGINRELSVFVDIKPGQAEVLRETLLKWFNKPEKLLDRIPTLHESRYVILDDGKRLMFCTTYDGEWDKYIDDFASIGTEYFDDIFQYAVGWPGITNPEVKNYFVAHQITATTYARSYDASVLQIKAALRLNEAFQQVLDDPAAAELFDHSAMKPLRDLASD